MKQLEVDGKITGDIEKFPADLRARVAEGEGDCKMTTTTSADFFDYFDIACRQEPAEISGNEKLWRLFLKDLGSDIARSALQKMNITSFGKLRDSSILEMRAERIHAKTCGRIKQVAVRYGIDIRRTRSGS